MSTDKIQVQVDSDLRAILPGFLKNREKDILKIESGLRRLDFKGIEVIGHQIKGNSGGYGLHELGKVGEALEKAAVSNDCNEIRKNLEFLRSYLSRVEIVFVES